MRYIIVGIFLVFCKTALAGNACEKINRPEMVLGVGESETPVGAKAAAITDAIALFGVKIDYKGEVHETNESIYTNSSVRTEVSALVKGAEVVSECHEGTRTKIIVGIKRTLLTNLIAQHCEQRQAWVTTTLKVISDLDTKIPPRLLREYRDGRNSLLEDEKTDMDSWIILGSPKELFAVVPNDLLTKLSLLLEQNNGIGKTLTISAVDNVASETLPLIIQRLNQEGYKTSISSENSGVQWGCLVTRGVPIGTAVRFAVKCVLTGTPVDIQPISVSGIAPVDGVNTTAVRLVSGAFNK